jgi:hypothetical protein
MREAAVQVSVVDMGRGSRPGDLHRRRVLLVAESAGLAAVLHHLLDPADRLSRLSSPRELAETRALEAADVVVLDVPPEDRAAAVGQVRRRYLGPLVVLVARGDNTRRLGLDDACSVLPRPFSADELGAALAGVGSGQARPLAGPEVAVGVGAVAEAAPAGGAATAGGSGGAAVDPKAAARQAPVRRAPAGPPAQLDLIDRAQRLLAALTQGWQAKRRVRVVGFSAFALVAFTVAFALAAAQGRCGPGCDALGTGFSPAPTIAASESTGPATTAAERTTSTTTRAGSPATGAFAGISGGRLAATTTTLRARAATTTTTGKAAVTTRPATTRPATTQSTAPPTTPTTAPPTTAPPTTAGA